MDICNKKGGGVISSVVPAAVVRVGGVQIRTYFLVVVVHTTFLLCLFQRQIWSLSSTPVLSPAATTTTAEWFLQGNVTSKTSSATCGFQSTQQQQQKHAAAAAFFRDTIRDRVLGNLTAPCHQLAVFSAALDHASERSFQVAMKARQKYSREMLHTHGRCFFLFTSDHNNDRQQQPSPAMTVTALEGHYWVIPLPSWTLPYTNPHQNTNFVKYSAHLLFQRVQTLVWQDAATFFSPTLMYSTPPNYHYLLSPTTQQHAPCITTIAMPINQWTATTVTATHKMSRHHHDNEKSLFWQHCTTLQHSAINTVVANSIQERCQSYMKQIDNLQLLDQAMVSTSLLIWNNYDDTQDDKNCQRFNAQLQCTMLDELHRYHPQSGDTITFPYALSQFHLDRVERGADIHGHWNRQVNEVDFFWPGDYNDNDVATAIRPMVRIIRTNCHWNRGPLGTNCHYWKDVSTTLSSSLPIIPFGPTSLYQRVNTTTTTSLDYRTCTSPELAVDFPLKKDDDDVGSRNSDSSSVSCGLKASNTFSTYLKEHVRDTFLRPILQDCRLVVFGVALGKEYVQQVQNATWQDPLRSKEMIQRHGKCFVMFVSQTDMPQQQQQLGQQPTLVGHFWLTPIPPSILPYKNDRRNAKLLKYMGHLVFPENVSTIIWQDTKFFSAELRGKQPLNYHDLVVVSKQNNVGGNDEKENNNNDDDDNNDGSACVTTFGMPVHAYTVGAYHRSVLQGQSRPGDKFKAHCNTIVRAIERRPNITDSTDSVAQQCLAYVKHVEEKEMSSTERLNQGMVDTAFIIWNHASEQCRRFSKEFRCTLLDQIHCHSDRDQVSFPFVLYEMGLQGFYSIGGSGSKPVDAYWNPRVNDLELRRTEGNTHNTTPTTLVRIARQNCHWYKNPIGQGCKFWEQASRKANR